MSFGAIEDNVILFFHVEHASIEEHDDSRAGQHRFHDDQTHKGSCHLNLLRMDTSYLIVIYRLLRPILEHKRQAVETEIRFGVRHINCKTSARTKAYWTETFKRYCPELKTNPPVSARV